MKRTLAGYAAGLALFLLAVCTVLQWGRGLVPRAEPVREGRAAAPAPGPVAGWTAEVAPTLLLQVALVLAATAMLGAAARRLGQPAVAGELLGGVLLGPSALGLLAPRLQEDLFPAWSMPALSALAHLGTAVFMVLVGASLPLGLLRRHAGPAVLVSHASIALPFLLGCLLALGLYPRWAPAGVAFSAFALFMGAAMSVTAFPVLVRILQAHRLEATPLGVLVVACAAVDDVSAWAVLALVLAVVHAAGVLPVLTTLAWSALYVGFMGLAARPLLARLGAAAGRRAEAMPTLLLAFGLAGAVATEAVGVHAVFGAFVAGLVLPEDGGLRRRLRARFEPFSTRVLVPLFFALIGLRTDVRGLDTPEAWLACLAVLAVAVAGKLLGTAAAAHLAGLPAREALAAGVLMNARGLMGLVVTQVGYEAGILSPPVFAMLVLMAVATTLATSPLLRLTGTAGGLTPSLTAARTRA